MDERPFVKTHKDARTENPNSRGDYLLRDQVFPGATLWWKIHVWINKPENYVMKKNGVLGPMNRSQAWKIIGQQIDFNNLKVR